MAFLKPSYNYFRPFGSAAPIPTDNLVLALNSENVVKSTVGSDELVSQLNSLYGVGNDATQATDANKPKWLDNQINGYPSLQIPDGDLRYMDFTKIFASLSNYTIYIVLKHQTNSSTTSNRVISGDSALSEGQLRTSSATSTIGWGVSQPGSGNRFSDVAPTPSNWAYLTATPNNLYFSGVEETYFLTDNPQLKGLSRLFASVGGTIGNNFVGEFASIYVYDVIHNGTTIGNVESYLSTKYNL